MKKQIQIGIIGSMCDIKQSKETITIARKVGKELAACNAALLFSFEGDKQSLPFIAALEAENNQGNTVAFLWSEAKPERNLFSTIVRTGQLRGGGREFSFVLSTDAIICIGGGSGTLMEIAMAYQAGIPIIAIKNTGGWSEKLMNTFLDERKRSKVFSAKNAKDAVQLALKKAVNFS